MKMKNSLIVATVLLLTSAFVQAQPQDNTALAAQLLSAEKMSRVSAAQELVRQNGLARNAILATLRVCLEKPDKNFDGSFDLTLQTIRQWKMTETIGPLISKIDFQLDPMTAPNGGRRASVARFPVASTLASLGGKTLPDEFFLHITRSANEVQLRLICWVLVEAYGKDFTQFAVLRKLTDITEALKRTGIIDTNPEKRNLERMKQLLESNEPLLPSPEMLVATQPMAVPLGAGVVRD